MNKATIIQAVMRCVEQLWRIKYFSEVKFLWDEPHSCAMVSGYTVLKDGTMREVGGIVRFEDALEWVRGQK